MINFRWGQAASQAASQASGFNLAGAQSISSSEKKKAKGGGGGKERRRPFRSVIAWVHLRTPTVLSSVPQHPSLLPSPFLPTWLN